MKILVLGSTGMAGHVITLYLRSKGHEVFTFSRKKFFNFNEFIGDAMNLKLIEKLLFTESFNAVINAIGVLTKDSETNLKDAIFLNSFLPHHLEFLTTKTNCKIIHLSTDCVFSGKRGGYVEKDIMDGVNIYDKTKALGELNNSKDLTIRTSIFGPDIDVNGLGLFTWFMKQQNSFFGYLNSYWSGVSTITLAEAINAALSQNLSGIFHLVNNEKISKFDLLSLFNKHFKNNSNLLIPYENTRVDKSLINTRNDFNFTVPKYEEMIINTKSWISNYLDIYSHYNLKGK